MYILLYLQKDTKGDYETIEMFECAKNNTNDQCKRMSSSYYFITNTDVNTTNNEMLHDTSMTNSIPPVCNQNHHVLQLTHTSYNIISYTQSDAEQQAADGESHEPMFVDPSAKEKWYLQLYSYQP